MAGFNFQTMTIINSENFDKVTTRIDGKNVENVVKIKNDFVLLPDYIQSVSTREGADAVNCKATVDFSKLTSIVPSDDKVNYCRLEVYVTAEGAEPAAYTTAAQKGKPFWVEFTTVKGETAANIAKKVADLFEKNDVFVLNKKAINATVSGNTVVFEANQEYLRFGDIKLHICDAYTGDTNKVAALEKDSTKTSASILLNVAGTNGFGTYSHILKDLRLPTAANGAWMAPHASEAPVVGALYDQYIIEYCAPAPHSGMQTVGQKMEQHTTHVFWVKKDLSSTFKGILPATKIYTVTAKGVTEPTASTDLDA